MKQTLVLLLTIALSMSALAQCGKGSHQLGGSLYFNSYTEGIDTSASENKPKTTSYGIIPTYGYSINDNWVVGLGLGYSGDMYKYTDPFTETEYNNKTSLITIHPYVRYYKAIMGALYCTPSLGLNVGLGSYKDELTNSGNTTTNEGSTMSMNAAISGGLTYFLATRYALAFKYGSLGYTMTSDSPDESDAKYQTSNFGLDLSTKSLEFCFYWYFGCNEVTR